MSTGGVWPLGESDVDYSMSLLVLDCPMDPKANDAGASSIREYMALIACEVWRWQDGFSGKRPFGNSGWCWEVYQAVIDRGLVEGVASEDDLTDEQRRSVDAWVLGAIWLMGRGPRE